MFAHKNYKSPPSKIGLAHPHVIWAKNLTKPLANSEVEVEVAVETVAKAGVSQIKFLTWPERDGRNGLQRFPFAWCKVGECIFKILARIFANGNKRRQV